MTRSSPYDMPGVNPNSIHNQEINWGDSVPDVPMINISMVEWPKISHYGSDHHQKMALLATHIARAEGLSKKEINAIWCAAMMHDVCRNERFGVEDPSHAHASARYAHHILKMSDYKNDDEMIDRACWLIANNSYNKITGAVTDLALRCMLDADRLEVVRIDPNGDRGADLIQKIAHPSKMLTEFARQPGTVKRWMHFRGWTKR
jgi:HD domain